MLALTALTVLIKRHQVFTIWLYNSLKLSLKKLRY